MAFEHLPTPADRPRFNPQPKGQSRLQATKAERKITVVDERAFKHVIWTRDKGRCRMCDRKVVKGLARVPARGEIHHLHGRVGALRFEAKAALLVCCESHEKLTGRVAEKWIAIGTKFWTGRDGEQLIDARAVVHFRKTCVGKERS